jgi:FAD/FMN-containing dehydrogenase
MLVLSLERLSRTLAIDAVDRTVTADAGVRLSQLDTALAEQGLLFPIDLGADPTVGGMVATNAAGTRVLRYGDVRQNLLGLEVVLADGTVLDLTTALRKNNTGLDAKQVFVGTSGVFGVVTRAVLRVVPRPAQRATALVGAADGATMLQLLAHLERRLGDVLSAFEVMSAEALAPVFRYQPRLRNPFGASLPPQTALVELSTTLPAEAVALDELLETTLGALLEEPGGEGLTDIFPGKPSDLWDIRHHVSESHRHEGEVLGFDISVPRSSMAAFVEAARALLAPGFPYVRVCDFGHWGDGGVHLNLVWRPDEAPRAAAELKAELQPLVYELAVGRFRGSYSAEHGVGPHNQAFYDRYTPERVRDLCRTLKERLDPRGVLGTTRLG